MKIRFLQEKKGYTIEDKFLTVPRIGEKIYLPFQDEDKETAITGIVSDVVHTYSVDKENTVDLVIIVKVSNSSK